MGKRETALQKAGKNSKYIWTIIILLTGMIVGMYKIAIYIKDTSDLPARVKTLEKDNEKCKPLLTTVPKLEERQSALEIQITAGFNRIETKIDQVQMTQNIINSQFIKSGLEHNK